MLVAKGNSSVGRHAFGSTAVFRRHNSVHFPSKQLGIQGRVLTAWAHAKAVVLVESPTKAKKIQQFLGTSYQVLATYGHIRDLPPKPGSVDPESDFAMMWELMPGAAARVKEIEAAVAGADKVVLATDPDREGEAISWHVVEALRARGLMKRGKQVERITFVEVTQKAIQQAMKQPRQLSLPLVDAYLARRALDFLYGFHLSPLLWRKLQGAKSAGRVQSVALRLACEREMEIEAFSATHYWSIGAELATARGQAVYVVLAQADGKRLGQMDIQNRQQAEQLVERIKSAELRVSNVSSRQVRRQPPPPFITSSLQQEAAARLGFSASRTMRVAQQLYEGAGTGEGLITYMRTDGVHVSAEAVTALRRVAAATYGQEFVPDAPRQYSSRVKNAQEAHEAIRPTKPDLCPDALPPGLDGDQHALYGLIWARAVASQMTDAVWDQVSVDVASRDGTLVLRAGGSSLQHPGYTKAYGSSSRSGRLVKSDSGGDESDLTAGDGGEEEEAQAEGDGGDGDGGGPAPGSRGSKLGNANSANSGDVLRALKASDPLLARSVTPHPHATRPPPRYTEASLVKALEGLGIGRPSTYAPIMQRLQERGYVSKDGRALVPSPLGRLLSAFLTRYFPAHVDFSFTADLENQLDEVSAGGSSWKQVLRSFWDPFNHRVLQMYDVKPAQVFDELDAALGDHFFAAPSQQLQLPSASTAEAPAGAAATGMARQPPSALEQQQQQQQPGAANPRACPKCGTGRLVLKPSRTGGFIGCSNYSKALGGCDYARPLGVVVETGASDADDHGGCASGGGSSDAEGAADPHADVSSNAAASAARGATPQAGRSAGGRRAVAAVADRALGVHPQWGTAVVAKVGPYGAYVQADEPSVAADSGGSSGTSSKKKAGARGKKAAAASAASTTRRASLPAGLALDEVTLQQAVELLSMPRQLGLHPGDGQPVMLRKGRFGLYVQHGELLAPLAKTDTVESTTLDKAVELLRAKAERASSAAATAATTAATAARHSPAPRSKSSANTGSSESGSTSAGTGVGAASSTGSEVRSGNAVDDASIGTTSGSSSSSSRRRGRPPGTGSATKGAASSAGTVAAPGDAANRGAAIACDAGSANKAEDSSSGSSSSSTRGGRRTSGRAAKGAALSSTSGAATDNSGSSGGSATIASGTTGGSSSGSNGSARSSSIGGSEEASGKSTGISIRRRRTTGGSSS